MNILSLDFNKQMKELGLEKNLGLNDYEYDCYSNLFYVIYELTDKKLSFYEIAGMYDFFTDILEGKEPQIDSFSHSDAYRGFYRFSKRYKPTKNLSETERCNMCYAIYQASCIRVYDDVRNEETWNMDMFEKGTKYVLKSFEYERQNFPSKYTIKKYSDYTLQNYGLCVENPIEVTSVENENKYLNVLVTDAHKPIMYERVGSLSGKEDIIVDKYSIYVKSIMGKKQIASIFITGYGNENSLHTPNGFKFVSDIK